MYHPRGKYATHYEMDCDACKQDMAVAEKVRRFRYNPRRSRIFE